MFDLKREVEAWSEKAYGGPCHARAATVAELQDHLYCEIERLEGEGRSKEEAFRIASAKLTAAAAATASPNRARLRWGRVANGLLWAVLILATSLVLTKGAARGSAARDNATYLLLFVLIPMWIASDLLLTRLLRAPAAR